MGYSGLSDFHRREGLATHNFLVRDFEITLFQLRFRDFSSDFNSDFNELQLLGCML